MAVIGRAYPVDGVLAIYNLVMALIWMNGAGAWAVAPWLVVAHLAAAGLPWLLRRARSLSRPVRLLRRFYPLLWLAVFWTEVDLVRRHLHDGANDGFVIALERSLIGVHLHEVWMPRMHDLWLSEALHFSYFAYYVALAVPILWLARRRRPEDLFTALFRMMTVFVACFILFGLFPVDGPRHTGIAFDGPNAAGFFARLVDVVAREHGEALGAAFPSSHVAGAVTMAWIARLHLPRWAFRVLAVEAIGVFLATFYTQQHYAIDAVAGLLLAVAIQGLVVPAVLARSAQRRSRPLGLPPLLVAVPAATSIPRNRKP